MREVELKAEISPDNIPALISYLEQQGYTELGTIRQEDDYYNHPSRDFRKTDEAFRLRSVTSADGTPETFITYKGRNLAETGQSREELECGVSDAAVMRAVLDRLGFVNVAPVHKTRRAFKNGDVTVCVDEVDGLGTFFEAEIVCAEADEPRASERLTALMDELAFVSPVMQPKTYLELIIFGKTNG